jgi:hypothetical protein
LITHNHGILLDIAEPLLEQHYLADGPLKQAKRQQQPGDHTEHSELIATYTLGTLTQSHCLRPRTKRIRSDAPLRPVLTISKL